MLEATDAEAVASVFGLGQDPLMAGPVARGEVGQVWRLTTSQGAWAVKETFEAPPLDEIEDQAVFQERATAAGVAAPSVRRALHGAVLADVRGGPVRVYGWVDVADADPLADPVLVGEVVAAVHRVRYTGSNPLDPWYAEPVGSDRWAELAREVRAARAPFADAFSEQLADIVASEDLIVRPETLQTCHRDLFADNVRTMPGGGLCVIDWENAGLADPAQELAVVVFEFACGDRDRARLIYDAYLAADGPGRLDRPDRFSMLIAQLGHIAEIGCRRWLDPARRPDRARNQARVEEFLARRCTADTIDLLLDAVR